MRSQRAASGSGNENNEDERAFLQSRVALFWKVTFFIVLIGSVLGAIGAVVRTPGPDVLLTLASATQAGVFWWLCGRGVRSIRFSRAMESGGLLLNSFISAFTGRYLFAGFARDLSLVAGQAVVLADAYVSLMQLAEWRCCWQSGPP